jgi:16S rRNA (adenine1518-N6/adenine1519-N6)-dimethyltransferase
MAKPFQERFSVTGNFPYNISSQILFKVLEWKEDVLNVVGMFSKRSGTKSGGKRRKQNLWRYQCVGTGFF